MKKRLKKNGLIISSLLYTMGSFFIKGINFFTLPIFTRLLDTTDYGMFTIYTTWNGLISIFIGLGINGTIGSAKANLDESEYNEYLSTNMFMATLLFIFVLFISVVFNKEISNIIGLSDLLCVLLIIHSFFSFVVNFMSSVYTFDKQPKKYLALSLIITLLNVGISIVLIMMLESNKYLGRIYGSALVTIVIGIMLYLNILFKGKKLISKKYWRYCLPMAIPIIFHNISHLVLNQADRIMLQYWTDESTIGIYSFTYNIGIILNIINMSINSAWVAWYFDLLKRKSYYEIKSKSKWYIGIFTILTILFLLASPEVIKITSPIEYWSGIQLLPIIIVGYYFVFLYTFGVNYEFYKKKTMFIAIGTVLAAFINILLNAILIPIIGVRGATISTLIAYIMLFVMHEFIVRIIFKHKDFPFYYYLYSLIIVFISTIVTYIFLDNVLLRWITILMILNTIVLIIFKVFKFKIPYNNIIKFNTKK